MQFVSLGRNESAFAAVQRAMMSGRLRTNNLSAALIFEACAPSNETALGCVARDLARLSRESDDRAIGDYLVDSYLPLLFNSRLNASGLGSCAFRIGGADPVVVGLDGGGARRLAASAAESEIVTDARTLLQLMKDVLAYRARASSPAGSAALHELSRADLGYVAGGGPCNPDVCLRDSCSSNSCTQDICGSDTCSGNSCEVDFCAIDLGLPNEN